MVIRHDKLQINSYNVSLLWWRAWQIARQCDDFMKNWVKNRIVVYKLFITWSMPKAKSCHKVHLSVLLYFAILFKILKISINFLNDKRKNHANH
ncbi:hypothetical protein B5J93_04845 [Moraxella equi]|uniref:Uncharacterized protein n=1 Tax=Moraxella equi TaxID=60442 RepID=A0ABX3NJ94_9GAMM|nr:hypothetical protein B5J93_04845 [Moraxella equi]